MKLGLRKRRGRALARRYGRASVHRARWYNVWLAGKSIDAVHYTATGRNKAEREDEVYRSLVNHDGYDAGIKVVEGKPRGSR